jgi:hypothetical protein
VLETAPATVVADVYFVDFPVNPAYAFIISAAPIVQYTAPIGPEPQTFTCRCCGSDVPTPFPVDYCAWCRS